MSAPPSFMQGLLQSLQPWMTGANPSALDNSTAQYGGTNGLLDALMQGAGPDTTQARQGAALERARGLALQQAAQRQGLAQGALGTQLMASKIPAIQAYYRMLSGMMGANGDQGAQGGPGVAPSSPISQAPSQNGATPSASPAGSQGPQQAPMGASPGAPPSASAGGPAATGGAPGGFWSNPLGVMRFGTLGAALGLPGGQQFADYGKTAIQYDPATATRMALAKDPLALDRAEMADAQQRQDPQGYLSAYTKMLTDANRLHISSMSGNVTGFGLPAWVTQSMTNYNPQTGKITANGRQGLIPGAADTEAALEAARAGAEERAKLQAQTAPAGASGAGGAAPIIPSTSPTPAPRGAASTTTQLVVPQGYEGANAVNQEGYIPPILARPGDIPQRPGNTSLGQLQEFQKEQSEKASQLADQMNEQAGAAQQVLTQAGQIDDAARDFSPGKLADVKRDFMAWGQQFGFLSPDETKALGSAQEGDKLSIQLQAMVTKQLGSREAAQVFSVMGRSIPNLTLSPDGLGKISAYLKGIARYQIAQNTFAQRLAAQGNVAGVNGLSANFQNHSNPVYYILSSAPPEVAKELIANMPASERAKVQSGWKQAISQGLAPAPGDYE